MPNWVDCDFIVEGSKNELQKFKKFAKEGKKLLSANKFIPYPEKYRKLDEIADKAEKEGKPRPNDGFNSGGYEWCIENWGTKWGISHSNLVDESENRLTYALDSAWSPPLPVIQKMSEVFPELTFKLKYYESANGFKGTFMAKGGKVIKNEYSEDYHGNRGG